MVSRETKKSLILLPTLATVGENNPACETVPAPPCREFLGDGRSYEKLRASSIELDWFLRLESRPA